ncbi:MAG: poly-beta-1,6-N-acetyl-D-glucosamine N-deacetylase PgaB, partial [Gemmatimonadota bacterium]|nr:poly-beta-1,6-N-acetyl-D-glucosamine N-deacetylase PgaB [Gemmatimonadota bacterium]
MTVSLSLEPGPQPAGRLRGIRRFLIGENPAVADLAWLVERSWIREPVERVVHVDLDYLYDPDPEQAERNLDRFLERILDLAPSTVYLQAFADPDGDGTASALYFPNRHLPMRADLFNRVAWQLETRIEVDVFAWLPVLGFELPDSAANERLSVKRWGPGNAAPVPSRADYRRLSPWIPEARRIIGDIYEDLGKAAAIDGLVFHDDAYLSDAEDAAAYPDEPGRLPTAREKTLALIDFTDELAARARQYRPRIETARNLYAEAALNPAAESWLAQNLELFLDRYDWTAVMAMPLLEGAADADDWLDRLAGRIAAAPGGLSRTLFELQAVDWRSSEPVDPERLAAWMRRLERRGAIHFGYYPDDVHRDVPRLATIRTAFSTRSRPWTGR